MQSRIGHVHVRYRVPKGSPSSAAVIASLDRLAHQRIAAACDRALSEIFEGDPAVYAVRRVSARVAVLASRVTLESRLAEQWGHRLGAAVVRSIAEEKDGDNLVRFQNQAQFVVRFLADFVAGTAWDRWYFGAFRCYREVRREDVILGVLQDNREFFWEIWSGLKQLQVLDAVIALLGPHKQLQLWNEVVRGANKQDSPEVFRFFVQSAFRVLDILKLWSGVRPSESDILDAYLRTEPATPQWRSHLSLAEAVAEVIRFLAQERFVSLIEMRETDSFRLEQILTPDFDWLDVRHLTQCVISLAGGSRTTSVPRSFVLRPLGTTPTHKHLLEALRRLVLEGRCRLDAGDSTPQANLLRLMAVLSDQTDGESLAAVTAILESIVGTWMILKATPRPADALTNLRRGFVESILDVAHTSAGDEAARHLKAVAHAGEPAIALVEELAAQFDKAPATHRGIVIESECAGLFFLVRAVQDIRLTSVLKECGFDSISPLLTGLAIRIGGSRVWTDGRLDPGAALWAGIEAAEAVSCLSRLETLDRDKFDAALLDLLSAQRLIEADEKPFDAEPQSFPCSTEVSAMLDRTAGLLLRAWARWLPGLGGSSVPYLLRNFIHCSGMIEVGELILEVRLASLPLAVVLKMAGYLDDCPAAPWLGTRAVRFRIGS
jgi:hypothetical protein